MTIISVKEAVIAAFKIFHELYKDKSLENILLEEVELEPPGDNWIITIGFDLECNRRYKSLKIDAERGEFIAMRDRDPQSHNPFFTVEEYG
jgi:hypothetical protein